MANKFENLLTLNGKELLTNRAQNIGQDLEESFNDQKRAIQKRIRALDSEVFNMEDVSVKTTDSLVVGENMKVESWAKRRIEIELERRDLKIELDIINSLIDEYFSAQ